MSTEHPGQPAPSFAAPVPRPEAAPGATAEPAAAHETAAPGPVARVWSLRTVAAAAITAVALSGVGGAALAAAANGSDERTGGRGGFGGGFGGPPGFSRNQVPNQGGTGTQGGPGGAPPVMNGVPGQLPPATSQGQGRTT